MHTAGMAGHHEPRVAPRHREPIHYSAPARFHNHGHHYYGYHIDILPHNCIHHCYWGHDYWLHDGIYYRYWDGHYYVCRPPYGTWFDRSLYELELMEVRMAYYNTINRAYDVIDENYATIQAQNAQIAANNATIAAQNANIAAGSSQAASSYNLAASLGLVQSYADASMTYYYDDGIFFILKDGQYITIVPPAGAIVESLPDDYETISLGGHDYFKVDDTIYRMVINGGKPVFEVLGQLPQ